VNHETINEEARLEGVFLLLSGFKLALLIVGCATIIYEIRQNITVSSVPFGAKVIVKDVYNGDGVKYHQ